MKEITSESEVLSKLKEVTNSRRGANYLLVVDGETLNSCVFKKKKMEQIFFKAVIEVPSVCVCRCSPTDKAYIVKCLKKYSKKRICAVGDGGNDVSMILESNMGIGIVGKEGNQASLAADYSINQFKYLSRLLLWHGRICFKRSAVIAQYIIHRGLIITTIQFLFSMIFYKVTISAYDGLLVFGYTTIFNNFPMICMMIDSDVTSDVALEYSPLYKTL